MQASTQASVQRSLFQSFQTVPLKQLPERLHTISGPPQQLYIAANHDNTFAKLMARPRVAIVGSRKVSAYGQEVTHRLASELAAQGVVIISGLALGVDAIAHRATLESGGLCLAVLPTPVQDILPKTNERLAADIINAGGALVSEYPENARVYKTNFVARNRLVTGLADALLIVEATEKSGTLHTANFALGQGVDLLVVPGNITNPNSVGTNNLIKSGALPITDVQDIFLALGINSRRSGKRSPTRIVGANPEEQCIIDLLEQGITDGSELLSASNFTIQEFNHNLTMLEITAKIRSLGANHWALR